MLPFLTEENVCSSGFSIAYQKEKCNCRFPLSSAAILYYYNVWVRTPYDRKFIMRMNKKQNIMKGYGYEQVQRI